MAGIEPPLAVIAVSYTRQCTGLTRMPTQDGGGFGCLVLRAASVLAEAKASQCGIPPGSVRLAEQRFRAAGNTRVDSLEVIPRGPGNTRVDPLEVIPRGAGNIRVDLLEIIP